MPSLDIPTFRLAFPAFADEARYPDALISRQWTAATLYLTDTDGCLLAGAKLQYALELTLAHLLASAPVTCAGDSSGGGLTAAVRGAVTSATIGDTSVTVAGPPTDRASSWWWNGTPYGAQLLAFLRAKSAGGFYVGGSSYRQAYSS